MSNLLMEYWFEPTLRAIGNLLGKMMSVDDSFLWLDSRTVVKVLVKIDVSKDLYESLDLVRDGKRHTNA
jgi:hypothetical protein